MFIILEFFAANSSNYSPQLFQKYDSVIDAGYNTVFVYIFNSVYHQTIK